MIESKSKHTANKRGRTSGSIVRRWNAGYHVETIATELEIAGDVVMKVLLAAGVRSDAIATRMRNRTGMAGHKRQANLINEV